MGLIDVALISQLRVVNLGCKLNVINEPTLENTYLPSVK